MSFLLVIDWIFMKFQHATHGFLSICVLWYNENQGSLAGIILEVSQLTSVCSEKEEHLNHP